MKFEKTQVWGFEHAIRGMRNPMNSWDKSDSKYITKMDVFDDEYREYSIGENDMNLMQRLIRGGTEHRKFMRQIFVSVDITAPLFWWSEADTYRFGIDKNSCSKMHKIASKEITIDDFEMGDFAEDLKSWYHSYYEGDAMKSRWYALICILEDLRISFNETKDKRYWKELIRLLPESYLQKRTVTLNYENILTMIKQRKNHKLKEWSVDFINWTKTLPYAEELLYLEDKKDNVKNSLDEIDKMIENMIGVGGETTDKMCFEIQHKIKQLQGK